MSKELKDTQIYYGENVLMMRVDDCLIFGNKNALQSLAEKLTKLPSAEPERKKGEWKPDELGNVYWICSACGFASEAFGADDLYHFCPNCGADMRGNDYE